MEYGVVYYKDTDNIGDDIQSYAVFKRMPQVDYLIDREHMDSFDAREAVAVVLNGWFLHNKFNWPPSKKIYPCCLSMHFTPNDYMGIGYGYLDGVGAEFLKNYQPIGCRDQSTFDALQERGIESYLSGCVTLTLEQRKRYENSKKYICMVDIPEEAQTKIRSLAEKNGFVAKNVTHWVDYRNQPIEWNKRVERVEEILDLYQNAHCVVTKRLHCALPCLAMETPVLLLLDREQDDMTRYSHFTDLLHVTSTEAFVEGQCNFNVISPPENKKSYMLERENLICKIDGFLNETKRVTLPDSYLKWQSKDVTQILTWQKELAGLAANTAAHQVNDLLIQRGKDEKNTCERIHVLSKRYATDLDTVQKYLGEKEVEINRLNNVINLKEREETRLNKVIAEKEQDKNRLNNAVINKGKEENRLNCVIAEKEQEEKRLNSVIIEKEQEERRLNSVIIEKEQEERRLNCIIAEREKEMQHLGNFLCSRQRELDDKTEKLDRINRKIGNNENTSILWLLFFSTKFKEVSFRQKCKIVMCVIKSRGKRNRIGFDNE